MNEQQYLQERVMDQINWYEKKSAWNKKWFTYLKILETILALLIPFLSGYITDRTGLQIKVLIGLTGVIVAAVTNLITILKLQENWIQYRSVSESLKHEMYLYVTRSGPYEESAALSSFVKRFESYISKENAQWATYVAAKEHNSQSAATVNTENQPDVPDSQ